MAFSFLDCPDALAAATAAMSRRSHGFQRDLQPAAPASEKSLRTFAAKTADRPLVGWLDNVTANAEIEREIEVHARQNLPRTGHALGVFRPYHGDPILRPNAENRQLDLYIRKLESEGRKTKRKADALAAKQGKGKAAAENEGLEDAEDTPMPRATRASVPTNASQVSRLKAQLRSIVPMVEQGIINAHANDHSTAHGLGPDIITPNYERDGFRFTAYQKEGIYRWETQQRLTRAVLLCDEMGLGKTIIAMGVIQRFLDAATASNRSILVQIVVPSGLVDVWTDALKRSKTIRVGLYSSPRVKCMTPKELKRTFDVLIITHGPLTGAYRTVLRQYQHRQAIKEGLGDVVSDLLKAPLTPKVEINEDVLSLNLDLLLIDEAHWIKDPSAILSQAMRAIPAKARAAMTGTPIHNKVAEFGAILMFLGLKPFCNQALFKTVFPGKNNKNKMLEQAAREKHELNDAILACLRSYVCIRRLNSQDFDGISISDGVMPYHTTHVEVGKSKESTKFQLKTRGIWDPEWKKAQQGKFELDREDALDRGEEEEEQDLDDEAKQPPIKKRATVDTLVAVSEAKMHIIHPALLHAKYGSAAFEAAEDLTLAVPTRPFKMTDVRLAGETLGAVNNIARPSKDERDKLGLRRKLFLSAFEGPNPSSNWRSDRIAAMVEIIQERLQLHAAVAQELPTGAARNEYISKHKILVFGEYLAGLDLISIGLAQNGIKFSRFDGSVSQQERDRVRTSFEEVGKDFTLDTTLPDENLVMLITIKAGSEGITPVHATDCLLMSPMWNPALEDQSISRVYRKGQLSQVTVFKFYSEHSMENRILDVQDAKCSARQNVLSDQLVMDRAQAIRNLDDGTLLEALGFDRCVKAIQKGKLFI